MKRVMLFPYHPDIEVLIKNKKLLQGFEIVGVHSFVEDSQIIQVLNKIIGVEDKSYKQLLSESDILIILDNYRNFKIDKYYQVINDALKFNVEVYAVPIIYGQLNKNIVNRRIGRIAELETFSYSTALMEEAFAAFEFSKELHSVDSPVIGVYGMGKNCGKFDLQLMLLNILKEEYQVVSICTNPLGVLFGCCLLPDFFYSSDSFQDKIILANHFIKVIDKIMKPDVIILGVPEGVAPFSKIEMNHFAEYALVLSKAVYIDIAFLCTYFMPTVISKEEFRRIANVLEHKYNTHFEAMAISRVMYEMTADGSNELIYEYLDDDYLRKVYPINDSSNDMWFIDMFNTKNGYRGIMKGIQHLEGNAQTI